jgi:hypothetical protein
MDGNEDDTIHDPKDRTITIKSGLQTTLLIPELAPLIEDCVRFVSELSVRGSRIVNGFLLYAHATGIAIDIDNTTPRQTVVSQCFTAGVKGSKKKRLPVPGFAAWFEINENRYPPAPTPPDIQLKEMMDYARTTYMTAFHNNLWVHHNGRLYKYLVARFGDEVAPILHKLITWKRRPCDVETVLQLDADQSGCVRYERAAFGLGDESTDGIGEGLLKKNATACLTASFRYLSYVENKNKNIEDGQPGHTKLWTPAPLCTIKRHCMAIDSKILFVLFKKIGSVIADDMKFEDFWALAPDHFASTFDQKKMDKGRRAHGPSNQLKQRCYVQTDGVAISVQYRPVGVNRIKGGNRSEMKRKRDEAKAVKDLAEANGTVVEKKTRKTAKNVRADERRSDLTYGGPVPVDAVKIACDPGRSNIMYLVRDGDNKRFQLTRGRYYHESGTHSLNESWKKWIVPLQAHNLALADHNSKTASVDRYNAFLSVEADGCDAVWKVNYARRASRRRFGTYCGKKKVLQGFLASLGKGLGLGSAEERKRRVIVGFGQAKIASTGRGEMAVPTTQAFKECARMWHTRLVDENYTTCVCHDCDGRTGDLRTKRNINNELVIGFNRAVRRCTSECKATGRSLKHRDLNAALNILRCLNAELAGTPRPTALTRAGAPPRV